MNLLIIGAPGAGKGTISKKIVEKYGVAHISTGDILRKAIEEKTPVGILAQTYMDGGNLVPDSVIHDLIVERLSKNDIEKGFLFDGYPRTIAQAIDLETILKNSNQKIDRVINVKIEDETLFKRITGRRLCPTCGLIYNIYYKKTKVENICDTCGSELTIRKDDNAESLKIRLEAYHQQTQPIIEFYEKMNLVSNVNGDQERPQVFAEVENILEGLQ